MVGQKFRKCKTIPAQTAIGRVKMNLLKFDVNMPASCGVVPSDRSPSASIFNPAIDELHTYLHLFVRLRNGGVAAIIRKIMPQRLRSGSCSFRPFQR